MHDDNHDDDSPVKVPFHPGDLVMVEEAGTGLGLEHIGKIALVLDDEARRLVRLFDGTRGMRFALRLRMGDGECRAATPRQLRLIDNVGTPLVVALRGYDEMVPFEEFEDDPNSPEVKRAQRAVRRALSKAMRS